IDFPQTPPPVLAMTMTFLFDERTLLAGQQQHRVLQPFTPPLCEQRLRRLMSLTPPPPAPIVPLQMRSVDRPGDQKGQRLVGRHRIPPHQPERASVRLIDRITVPRNRTGG